MAKFGTDTGACLIKLRDTQVFTTDCDLARFGYFRDSGNIQMDKLQEQHF